MFGNVFYFILFFLIQGATGEDVGALATSLIPLNLPRGGLVAKQQADGQERRRELLSALPWQQRE